MRQSMEILKVEVGIPGPVLSQSYELQHVATDRSLNTPGCIYGTMGSGLKMTSPTSHFNEIRMHFSTWDSNGRVLREGDWNSSTDVVYSLVLGPFPTLLQGVARDQSESVGRMAWSRMGNPVQISKSRSPRTKTGQYGTMLSPNVSVTKNDVFLTLLETGNRRHTQAGGTMSQPKINCTISDKPYYLPWQPGAGYHLSHILYVPGPFSDGLQYDSGNGSESHG